MSNGEQNQFWTPKSFATISGCTAITLSVTSVISSVFKLPYAPVGLSVAIIISIMSVILAGAKDPKKYVVAIFNGFFIFLSAIGISSFTPYVNPNTAENGKQGGIVRPWVPDINLQSKNRILNQDLIIKDEALKDIELRLTKIDKNLKSAQVAAVEQPLAVRGLYRTVESGITASIESLKKVRKK